ncbi:inner nuclear membrane protein enriched at telomere/subtelomere region [Haplosporangium sp. Z 27]|nr:inner nuclear membrane protein enriched at telomere/subtelomere region [Haplosporangium sp. Z 27]
MPKEPIPRYLHPNYDPMKDKMDRLREILIHNKVKTPSGNVRKQDFVDLFEKHIRPQVPTLRQYYENVVASEEGIIKVPASSMKSLLHTTPESKLPTVTKSSVKEAPKSLSSSTSSTQSSSSLSSAPKLSMPSAGISGATNELDKVKLKQRIAVENEDSEVSLDMERGRKPRPHNESYTDETTVRVARRKRHSEKKKKRSDNFSLENPFQSGSESERRKRSKSRDNSSASRKSSKSRSSRSRRKSHDRDNPRAIEHDHLFNPSPQTQFSNYIHTPKYSVPSFDVADLDARFFHNSPLLTKSRRTSGATLTHPNLLYSGQSTHFHGTAGGFRRYDQTQQRNSNPMRLITFFVVFIFGMWYRQTRFRIGFCTATSYSSDHSSSWNQQTWDWIYPTCIPCPTHATCSSPHKNPVCPPEYILKPHPLSLGNFLPLTPECVLNRAKEYQSLQVADAVEQILHRKAGIEECKTFSPPLKTREFISRQQISLSELRRTILSMKDSSVSQRDFEQYWKLAVGEIYRRSDTVFIERGSTDDHLLSLKPDKPLVCRVRQGIAGWILAYRSYLLGFVIISSIGLLIRRHILGRREEERVIQGLVDDVLCKLADQSHYHYIDPVLCFDPYLPQIHLRDALLTDVQAPAKRQELWDKVSAIVDRNANVRVSAQEVRGEIHRVWEWVGASGVLSRNVIGNKSSLFGESNIHAAKGFPAGLRPKVESPRSGPHDNPFGTTEDSDLEFINPARSLYPSLKELQE